MRRILLVFGVLIGIASPAFAWSNAGHKIIASIAFRKLTAEKQQKVAVALARHPRYQEDFIDKIPDEVEEDSRNEWLFQQAAIWPDMARGFRGEALKEFHRPLWHYINVPHFLTEDDETALRDGLRVNLSFEPPADESESMNIVQAIRHARGILGDSEASPERKSRALPWLFHLVGDLHQPLHSTALFSRRLFREGDRGGNKVLTKQNGNLHSVWDRFPGGEAKFRTAHNEAIRLSADQSGKDLGVRAAEDLNEETWMNESHELCTTVVYDTEILAYLRMLEEGDLDELRTSTTLTENYLRTGRLVSNRRLIEAGHRLAALLEKAVE